MKTLHERVWSRVRLPNSDTGCMLWSGEIDRYGYGRVKIRGRKHAAHRVTYELANGEIPTGLVIDHLCRNRACVRPDHLEPVTNAENVRRGNTGKHNADKTHCAKGHEYTEENTAIRRSTGGRQCKECNRIKYRAWYARKRAQGLTWKEF